MVMWVLLVAATWIGVVGIAVGQGSSTEAGGEPDRARVEALLEAFGVANTPADLAVVVDRSGSMLRPPDPALPRVGEGLAAFIDATQTGDHLSLITFASAANVRFSGPLRSEDDRRAARGQLTMEPDDGAGTDIGRALQAALDRLERPGSHQVQVLVVVTDGQHQPTDGSRYGSTSGPAWDALRQRADELAERHTLRVFGVGLGTRGSTDIDLVGRVFADAQTVTVPPQQIGSIFAEAAQAARVERLRGPVQAELDQGTLVAEVVDEPHLDRAMTLSVVARSTHPHLPMDLRVTGVRVSENGRPIAAELVGDPRTLTVPAGGRSQPVEVRVTGLSLADLDGLGSRREQRRFEVALEGGAIPADAELLRRELGLAIAPTGVGTGAVDLGRDGGLPWSRAIIAAVALAILAAVVLWLWHRFLRLPALTGHLGLADGSVVPLSGRTMRLPSGTHVVPGARGDTVELFTRRGIERGRTGPGRVWVRPIEGGPDIDQGFGREPLDAPRRLVPTDALHLDDARLVFNLGR